VGEQDANGIRVTVDWMLEDVLVPYTMEYQICPDGSVVVTGSIDLTGRKLPELPRFGMRMELKKDYERLVYYGRGPEENYTDRCSSTFVGRYEDTVSNQFYPYIRPQETGNKTDVRWVSLLDAQGFGLKVQKKHLYKVNNLQKKQLIQKKQRHQKRNLLAFQKN
jgi:beta-galactosidase